MTSSGVAECVRFMSQKGFRGVHETIEAMFGIVLIIFISTNPNLLKMYKNGFIARDFLGSTTFQNSLLIFFLFMFAHSIVFIYVHIDPSYFCMEPVWYREVAIRIEDFLSWTKQSLVLLILTKELVGTSSIRSVLLLLPVGIAVLKMAAYAQMNISSLIYRKTLLFIWYGTDFVNLFLSAFLCWRDFYKVGHFPHLLSFYSLIIVFVSQLKSHAIRNDLYDLYDTVDKADNYADTATLAISLVILLIERKNHHSTIREVELINIV